MWEFVINFPVFWNNYRWRLILYLLYVWIFIQNPTNKISFFLCGSAVLGIYQIFCTQTYIFRYLSSLHSLGWKLTDLKSFSPFIRCTISFSSFLISISNDWCVQWALFTLSFTEVRLMLPVCLRLTSMKLSTFDKQYSYFRFLCSSFRVELLFSIKLYK